MTAKQEALIEDYKLALTALLALRKLKQTIPRVLKTGEDTSVTNLGITHQFALQNTETLCKRLQAEIKPGTPWHERKV